jgi:hypothetical protein
MKTEIKTEVLNYLNESSNHLFEINGDEYKILLLDDGDTFVSITSSRIMVYSIDKYIKIWGRDSKNVVKGSLFLIPRYLPNKGGHTEIKTIPFYKDARKKYETILNSIKNKTDKNEITNIVKNMI